MSAVRFTGAAPSRPDPVVLDPSQAAVVALPDGASAAVLGAPGTGKTTTIVELVADRVTERGWEPNELLVLTSSRASATRLRDQLALRLNRPTDGPLARTVSSFAFELVGAAARVDGIPVPRLLTGSEQDADLGALLEGHLESGSGPAWPDPLDADVRRLRGFRTELRELMGRATEWDVTPSRLRELGRSSDRPEWVAAADFIEEYLTVQSLNRERQLDSSELARFAVAAIASPIEGDRVSKLRLVVVDDLQEATESTLAILRALVRRGIAVIAFGDPDVAANAFRGGEPDALGRLAERLGLPRTDEHILSTAHRPNVALRRLTTAITERIGTAAAGRQRRATATRDAPTSSDDPSLARPALSSISATTPAREWAAIARMLREEHLTHGVPWNELAVVVRGSALAPGIARALALAEVPTRLTGGGVALRDDPASRALVALVEVGLGRLELTPELASELLLGPFGGLDAIGLRRLRLALRHQELDGGGSRTAGQLLVDALSTPTGFVSIDAPFGKIAHRLAQTLGELAAQASTATIEELLWIAWDHSKVAKLWHNQALGAGVAAVEANRNLDGIVALFASAKRFSERRPDAPAQEFLAELLDSEVSDDVLAPRRVDDAVLVTTPSGTVGLEFRTVVVAGLQDGVWPNLRPRGSLLSPHQLVRAVSGTDHTLDERKLVLDDELRMFALAVSRARDRVVLASVTNDDETASVFLSLLPDDAPELDTTSLVPFTLRGLTGRLRRSLTADQTGSPDQSAERGSAASTLARLAELRIPGAAPEEWLGLLEPSTTGPLFEEGEVPISPSRLEKYEESPLDWFLETIAGSTSSVAMNLGTILHWAMETATDPTVDAVWQAVEARWDELLFESPWLAEHQRRAARVLATGIAEYLRDFDNQGKQLVGAEKRFEFDLDRAHVSGSIDRVERAPDGRVVIVDLKTGSPITKQDTIDAHPQLGLYQLAYREGLLDEALAELGGDHSPGGAKLLYVKKGVDGKAYREGVQAALDEAGLDGFRDRIRQASIGMAAALFFGPPEPAGYGGGPGELGLRFARVPEVSGD